VLLTVHISQLSPEFPDEPLQRGRLISAMEFMPLRFSNIHPGDFLTEPGFSPGKSCHFSISFSKPSATVSFAPRWAAGAQPQEGPR
jgi:hypothetical protein